MLFEVPEAEETERDRQVSRAVDTVRDRFGTDAVRPARMFDERPGGRPPSNDNDTEDS